MTVSARANASHQGKGHEPMSREGAAPSAPDPYCARATGNGGERRPLSFSCFTFRPAARRDRRFNRDIAIG